MSGFFSSAFRLMGRVIQQASQFSTYSTSTLNNQIVPISGPQLWSLNLFRPYHMDFKAREGKRIKTHGWRARLKTKNGRRVLMRRILKGRYYISH